MRAGPGVDDEVTVGEAAHGEGAAVVALAATALAAGRRGGVEAAGSPLGRAVDSYGGRLPLPFGQGLCHVARAGARVVGMVYSLPPVRWLEAHLPAQRSALVHELAEIELLAVAEDFRTRGVGTRLIHHAEAQARHRGAQFVVAKVRAGQYSTMRWYRHRGYTVAAQGEALVFRTASGQLTDVSDGSDGHHLTIKPLQPGISLTRHTPAGRPPFLAPEHKQHGPA